MQAFNAHEITETEIRAVLLISWRPTTKNKRIVKEGRAEWEVRTTRNKYPPPNKIKSPLQRKFHILRMSMRVRGIAIGDG